jgi:hypothetical protein
MKNKVLVKKLIGYISAVLLLMLEGDSFLSALKEAFSAVALT